MTLKTKFNLPQGLGDTSKTQIKVEVKGAGKKCETLHVEKEIHKVQILDPATGTGTFLAQTVRHIYSNQFANMQGAWPQYVKEHLIPRLNGFELLMTSYAMAHLKLDMLLTETGAYANTPSLRATPSTTPPSAPLLKKGNWELTAANIPLQNEGVDLRSKDGVVEGVDLQSKDGAASFAPIDLLDYIYAVLHSPSYRETYKEFLKIDFPRVPYPRDATQFWQLVALGGELRKTHLLEACPASRMDAALQSIPINYPIGGNNVVSKLKFEILPSPQPSPTSGRGGLLGRVYINETQYFESVPAVAWSFYIGGYQPAQKWLKDRKGRALNHEDIAHYQKIIAALTKTHELMQAIDVVFEAN